MELQGTGAGTAPGATIWIDQGLLFYYFFYESFQYWTCFIGYRIRSTQPARAIQRLLRLLLMRFAES